MNDVSDLMQKLLVSDGSDCKPIYATIHSLLSSEPKIDGLDADLVVQRAFTHLLNVNDSCLHETVFEMLSRWIARKGPNQLSPDLKRSIMHRVVTLLTKPKTEVNDDALCFHIMIQFMNEGNKMSSSLVPAIVDAINVAQQPGSSTKCVREGCALLQILIKKNMTDVLKCRKHFHKAVFQCYFHAVAEIQAIAQQNVQLMLTRYHKTQDYDIKEILCELLAKDFPGAMDHLFAKNQELFVLEQIKMLIDIVGSLIFRDTTIVNGLMPLMEKAFKHEKTEVKVKAFECWRTLISNCSLSEEKKSVPRKLRLLTSPLQKCTSVSTDILYAICQTWWELVLCLEGNVSQFYALVCRPFLEFVCGISLRGGVATSRNQAASQKKFLQVIGCDVLLLFFERPLDGTVLYSPRKAPRVKFPSLKSCAVKSLFPKHAVDFFAAAKALMQEFVQDCEMLAKIEYLLKLMGASLLNIPDEFSTEYKNAVRSYSGLIVDVVREKLLPAPRIIKFLEKFCKFPAQLLISKEFYVGDSCIMQGDLRLTIIALVLHPNLISVPECKPKCVWLLQQLTECGLSTAKCPLVYADSIMFCLKNQAMLDICDHELLTTFWASVSSALYCTLQQAQPEILSEQCSQEFTIVCEVLTYPFEYIGSMILTKGSLKSLFCEAWGNLYCLFYRHVSGMKEMKINTLCAAVCSQLLRCLRTFKEQVLNACELALLILPIIVESIETIDIEKLCESSNGEESLETQTSKHLMPSFFPLIALIRWLLLSLASLCDPKSSTKDNSVLKLLMSCVEALNNFISKVTSSKFLAAILNLVAEPMSKIFEISQMKNINTKEDVLTLQEQLQNMWHTLSSHIQQYYEDKYDTSFLNIMSPLLEATMRHPRAAIRNRSREFWFASFGPNHTQLKFPSTMLEVITKLRPPLISTNGSCNEENSFTTSSEKQAVSVLMPQDMNNSVTSLTVQTCNMAQSLKEVQEKCKKSSVVQEASQVKSGRIISSDDLSSRRAKPLIMRVTKDKRGESPPAKSPKVSTVPVIMKKSAGAPWSRRIPKEKSLSLEVRKDTPVKSVMMTDEAVSVLMPQDMNVTSTNLTEQTCNMAQSLKEVQEKYKKSSAVEEASQGKFGRIISSDDLSSRLSSAGVMQHAKPVVTRYSQDKRSKSSPVKSPKFSTVPIIEKESSDAPWAPRLLKETLISPAVRKAVSVKSGVFEIDDLPSKEFVVIDIPTPEKSLLTKRQREARQKRSFVPAMYNELSQSSCPVDSMDTNSFPGVLHAKNISSPATEVNEPRTKVSHEVVSGTLAPVENSEDLEHLDLVLTKCDSLVRDYEAQKHLSIKQAFAVDAVGLSDVASQDHPAQNPFSILPTVNLSNAALDSVMSASQFVGSNKDNILHDLDDSLPECDESSQFAAAVVKKEGKHAGPTVILPQGTTLGQKTDSESKHLVLESVDHQNLAASSSELTDSDAESLSVSSQIGCSTFSNVHSTNISESGSEESKQSSGKVKKTGEILPLEDDALYVKTRSQVLQHSAGLTRSKLKSAKLKNVLGLNFRKAEIKRRIFKPKVPVTSELETSKIKSENTAGAVVKNLGNSDCSKTSEEKISDQVVIPHGARKRKLSVPSQLHSASDVKRKKIEVPVKKADSKSSKKADVSQSQVVLKLAEIPSKEVEEPKKLPLALQQKGCSALKKVETVSSACVSSLSRTQKILMAAKNQIVSAASFEISSCPKSPKIFEQISPPVISPILKKKSVAVLSPAGSKGKKVSFADPVVQGEKLIECREDSELLSIVKRPVGQLPMKSAKKRLKLGPISPEDIDTSKMELLQEECVEASTSNTIPSNLSPDYPPCPVSSTVISIPPYELPITSQEKAVDDSVLFSSLQATSIVHQHISSVISQLTSPMWGPGLLKLLKARNINKVQDLSALSEEDVKSLPITAPKMQTVSNVLKKLNSDESKNLNLVNGSNVSLNPVPDMKIDSPAVSMEGETSSAASPSISVFMEGETSLVASPSISDPMEGETSLVASPSISDPMEGETSSVASPSISDPMEGETSSVARPSISVIMEGETSSASSPSISRIHEMDHFRQSLEDLLSSDVPDDVDINLVWGVTHKLLNVIKQKSLPK